MKYAWNEVDWNQPTAWIAEQLGTSPNVVSRQRRKMAPETLRQQHVKKVAHTDRWKSVDWSQKTAVIARLIGCTRNTVTKNRRKFKTIHT